MRKEKILFISEIQDPYTKGSSTQIMTENIIAGLKEISNIHFIAIVDWDSNKSNVRKYFEDKVDRLTIIDSQLQLRKISNKYLRQLELLKFSLKNFNNSNLKEIHIEEYEKILTHSPSIESIKVAEFLKKNSKKKIKNYQYWSDPLALSGIYPNEVGIKRFLLFTIEKLMHKKADYIIFGTKTLYQNQKKIFNNKNFRYSDVSYSANEEKKRCTSSQDQKIRFGYSGQYNSQLRNIEVLYNVFFNNKFNELELTIVGESDLKLNPKENIQIIKKRYSQNDIKKIEEEFDVIVTLLNKNCIQIPGKLFYNINSEKPIIVILDGLIKESIKSYLESFNRFIFVENTEEDIYKLLSNFNKEHLKIENETAKLLLSPSFVSNQILQGGLTD